MPALGYCEAWMWVSVVECYSGDLFYSWEWGDLADESGKEKSLA